MSDINRNFQFFFFSVHFNYGFLGVFFFYFIYTLLITFTKFQQELSPWQCVNVLIVLTYLFTVSRSECKTWHTTTSDKVLEGN